MYLTLKSEIDPGQGHPAAVDLPSSGNYGHSGLQGSEMTFKTSKDDNFQLFSARKGKA